MTFAGHGRKIGVSSVGDETTGSARRGSETFLKISAKVSHRITLVIYPFNVTFVMAEKRAAAQRAEAYFFALLKESGVVRSDAAWKDVSGFLTMALGSSCDILPSM